MNFHCFFEFAYMDGVSKISCILLVLNINQHHIGGLSPDLRCVVKLYSDNTYTVPFLHFLLMAFCLSALLELSSHNDAGETLEQVTRR